MDTKIEILALSSLVEIEPTDWDACACPETADGGRPNDPFTTYSFLKALEDSGSVHPSSGWQPHYLIAKSEGQVVACAPLYGKSHSQGEFIFDHNWAQAYERSGGQYYPKLQIAVPFTPATGRRLLTRLGFEDIGRSALVQGATQLAENHQLSSLHITFCTAEEASVGKALGLMTRTSQQFHWHNGGYANFDAFLASLSSRKRKNIRKERQQAQAFGGTIQALTGDDIKPRHWDSFWRFYQDTGARKWGSPYLTREFFDIAQHSMRDDIMLVMAHRDGQDVAGALNFIGRDVIYGRYWGCIEDHPCLHFEACYYQAIDYAIRHGLTRVEAGAQGEHKLARGYLPVTNHSLHWFRDPGFTKAVDQYLVAEKAAVEHDIEILTAYGPFKKPQIEEQQ